MGYEKQSPISNLQSPISNDLRLVDTHCHIHDPEFAGKFDGDADELIDRAIKAGVSRLVCVGTDVQSSENAVKFCEKRENCYASVAIHPHEAGEMSEKQMYQAVSKLEKLIISSRAISSFSGRVVAIGECGLDYFYHDDPKTHQKQEKLLRLHLDLAMKYNLPLIFHIRDQKGVAEDQLGHGFSHFFEILEDYPDVRGVVHSFSAGILELEGVLKHGFYVGLNGIMTFSKSEYQLEAAKHAPLDKLVLETDAPFLTPAPFRGKICEPKHLRVTAEFLSKLRGESLEELARKTTANAELILGLKHKE